MSLSTPRPHDPPAAELRLGVDVGGTNTDAVIVDPAGQVLASAKSPTTVDVTAGVEHVIHTVLSDSGLAPSAIGYAMLGTTHCTNAIVTRRDLNRVGVLRLGAPATRAIEPLLTWPPDLRQAVCASRSIVHGGHEYDGQPLAALDAGEIRAALQDMRGAVAAVAISGVFSSVNPEHEHAARELVHEVLGDAVAVSLSSEIGSVSLLERENATVLNAALIDVARTAIDGFARAVRRFDIPARLFLGQNDGSLMSIDYALQYPIFTIASGPANSIRGAAYLSQLGDALVIDIGGTTTDIGMLHKGFPRESALAVEIGGVQTNFRMPDLVSIGLGGGSLVYSDDGCRVGPDSVGYRLIQDARAFGGQQLTATDLAIAAGRARLGDPSLVESVPGSVVEAGLAQIAQRLEDALDRMKLSAAPVPVVAVGGGSLLLPDRLRGASQIIRPPHAAVANAIGVAIAQVSGTVDQIFSLDTLSRAEALDQATQRASERAVAAGAKPESIEIIDQEEIPLAYLPGNAVRLKVKAVGQLG